MTSQAKEIIDLLCVDSSWNGFQQARQYISDIRTRAEARAMAQAVESADFTSRSDFETRSIRLAVVGALSTENLRDALTLQFLERGLFCDQYHGPFGQFSQEIRNPGSGLYHHKPDLIVLAQSRRFSETNSFTTASAEELLETIWEDVAILRNHFGGPVLIQNFVPPEFRPLGILDPKQELGIADFYRYVNFSLSQRCKGQTGVYVLDASHWSACSGLSWTSLHKPFFLGGCSTPDPLAVPLAREIAAFGAALKGFSKKVLVVDLDNTLWGGVIGEEGLGKIQIGGSFPGNVYAALQKQILALFHRGVILAINSKNNEEDAWEPFESCPEMILKREHFSSAKINWEDKVTNLREIADDLNLGLDSFVVLDDSDVERHWIRTALPEVHVIPAGDPLDMLRWLATCSLFDTLTFSAEDTLRAKSYAAVAQRNRLASETGDLEKFLHSLEVVVDIGRSTEAQLGRLAQMTQKTNQFNLTTRRYSEEQLGQMLQSPDWQIFFCSCRDKFADEGVVGTALVQKKSNDVWEIDTFLLSCRVLGRGVERAFLCWICSQAQQADARLVRGKFIRTKKNGQTENFYRDNGFIPISSGDQHSIWELQLPIPSDMWPSWVHSKRMRSELQLESRGFLG